MSLRLKFALFLVCALAAVAFAVMYAAGRSATGALRETHMDSQRLLVFSTVNLVRERFRTLALMPVEASRGDEAHDLVVRVMTENFQKVTINGSGFLLLLSPAGGLAIDKAGPSAAPGLNVVHPESGRTLLQDVLKAAETPEQPLFASMDIAGVERDSLIFAERIVPDGWYVVSVAFVDEVSAPVWALAHDMASAALGVTVVGVLAALLFAHRLTVPLRRLAAFARALPEEDFLRPRSTGGSGGMERFAGRGDEVGALSRALLFMDESLRKKVRELVDSAGARERMAGELAAAAEIQTGILPPPVPGAPLGEGRVSLAAMLRPAKEVGGDMYDYFPLPDGRICLAIGDVSGKGVPAALFMAMATALLREAAASASDPAAVARAVNRGLLRENPAGQFLTLFVAFVDPATGDMRFVNAGHNPPWLRRGGDATALSGGEGVVTGVFEDMEYADGRCRLAPGDALLLYTDGLTEALDAKESFLGDDAPREAFRRCGSPEPGEILACMTALVDSHADGCEQSDDVTMLCFCVEESHGG